MENGNIIRNYADAHKEWLWAGFKAKKDIERSRWWPGGNYKRENLPEDILVSERVEFEMWYDGYDCK